MNNTIDITKYLSKDSDLYSGREEGKKVRKENDLDKCDNNDNLYNIIINDRAKFISCSFFLGMFDKSFEKFGEELFEKKYKIVTNNDEYKNKVQEDILAGLNYIREKRGII